MVEFNEAPNGNKSVNANEFARYTGATTLEALTAAETKTALSLNNVENTALSSWAGTTNITTVGTISSGTWSGTALVSAKIGNDQIDSQHYVDASIDHAHLANNLIDGDNIQDNVIDSEHYVDGSIDNAHLASNAVTQFVVADESSDTTCFPLFVGSATGNLLPKTGSNLTFNSSTGALGAGPLTITGAITATGDITAFHSSDIALKENLINIPNPLEKISKISGYMFDWKDHKDPNVIGEGHDVGIIAQEVEKVLPEIVITRDNGKKAVNYQKIIPLLVESIKELKTEIESLKNSKS